MSRARTSRARPSPTTAHLQMLRWGLNTRFRDWASAVCSTVIEVSRGGLGWGAEFLRTLSRRLPVGNAGRREPGDDTAGRVRVECVEAHAVLDGEREKTH